jgi:hypothetical protein
MPQSTAKSFLGIAKEATYGTAVPPTAFLPVTTITPKDAVTLIPDKGWRGSMVELYGETAGPIYSTIDFDGDVYADTLGFLLAGVLGDVTVTGSTAPFSHAFAVLNSGTGQPTSYTVTDSYAVASRAYAGAKFSELGLKWNADGLLTFSAKATSQGSVTATLPTSSFTSVPPFTGWSGTAKIAGVVQAGCLDAEVTIKRPVSVLNTVDGTQGPAALWSGPVSVDGKMTLIMEDDTQLTNYLTAVQPALEFAWSQGTGVTQTGLNLHMSKCAYSAADITRGKDYVEVPVTFSAIANITDIGTSAGYSPIKATLTNAIAAGVFK